MTAVASVILPAHDEAGCIGGCLTALLESDPLPAGWRGEVIVVANGCRDDTAAIAGGFADTAAARGWDLRVIEEAQGGKLGALNRGDGAARGVVRIYLDADVTVDPGLVPALVAAHFRQSRIAAFSTACVYPYVDVRHQGAREDTAPTPIGEYANSCVGRERMFEHFSRLHGTPGRLLRLSYAIDMRYGVLHDVARAVLAEEPVSLAMGHVNVIWQGDANACALRSLAHATTPTTPLNLSGPEVVSIRALARAFGQRFGKHPRFVDEEAPTAWLVNTDEQQRLFGYPRVPLARLIDWTADWVAAGRSSLGKPTHFETRDGSY